MKKLDENNSKHLNDVNFVKVFCWYVFTNWSGIFIEVVFHDKF